jgi:uncharacterized protein YlxW (UPF0749 family)
MIRSKNSRFLISLCWISMCTLAFGADPDEFKTKIQFEIKDTPPPQTLAGRSFQPPSKTTHVAILFIKGQWDYRRNEPIEAILETSAGKAMSPRQRDLISNQSIQMCDNGTTISNYSYFRLFGVSETDTQKMVEAFMEVLENESKARKQSLLSEQQKLEQKIAQLEKQILQKEKEVQDAENKLKQIKEKVHYLSAGEARETIETLNKTLDGLNIDIVGTRVRLETITEELGRRTRADVLKLSDAQKKSYETMIWPRLEQMRIDELIELKVAEAKKATATTIRNEAEEFYNLSQQPVEIKKHLNSLKTTLSSSQQSLKSIEWELEKSGKFKMPLKVFQDKVTIYQVLKK